MLAWNAIKHCTSQKSYRPVAQSPCTFEVTQVKFLLCTKILNGLQYNFAVRCKDVELLDITWKKKFLQIKSEVFPKNKANFPQICMQCVTSHLHILLEKAKYVYSNIPLNKQNHTHLKVFVLPCYCRNFSLNCWFLREQGKNFMAGFVLWDYVRTPPFKYHKIKLSEFVNINESLVKRLASSKKSTSSSVPNCQIICH